MNYTHLQSAVSIESLAMLSSVVSKHGDDDTLKALAGILAEMGKPKTAEAVLTARREALAETPNPKNRSPMTTPELIQWLSDNSSGVYRPANDAADLIPRMIERETALVAALREARDFVNALLDSTPEDAAALLSNEAEGMDERINRALGLDAFDLGDNVLAESPQLSEYQGVIVGKRIETDGLALFAVKDQDGDCWDHEPEEIRLAD
jgi:hypothetical protein